MPKDLQSLPMEDVPDADAWKTASDTLDVGGIYNKDVMLTTGETKTIEVTVTSIQQFEDGGISIAFTY